MKKKTLIKSISTSMSCLLFLTPPLCSALNTTELNSKKKDIKSTVLKVGGVIGGTIGITALGILLYSKFSHNNNNSNNTEPNNTDVDVSKQDSKQDFDSYEAPSISDENFLSYNGVHKPNMILSKQDVRLLRQHVRVVNASVTDEKFLNYVSSNGETVVVNAANTQGFNGGGVCGSIFQAMGLGQTVPEVQNWKAKTGRNVIGTGNAFIHSAYGMKYAQYVMQTVGPDFRNYSDTSDAYKKLYEAYYNTIVLAANKGIKNVVIPAISMGIYATPGIGEYSSFVALKAIADALDTLTDYQKQNFKVYLCDFLSSGEAAKFFDGCTKLLNSGYNSILM